MRRDHHTDILDQDGTLHHYVAYPLPALKGMELALEIAAVAGPGLGQMFRGIGGQAVDPEAPGVQGLDVELGPELAKIPERLISRGGSALVLKLLDGVKRQTNRNGKDVFELVSTPAVFDEVYSANYQELIKVLWWALQINYLPFLPGSLNSGDVPSTGPVA